MTETTVDEPKPKIPRQEFAAKIKAKYPQYKDMDDNELVDKIVAKYPTYADTIEPLKKKEHGLALGQPGPEFTPPAQEPVNPSSGLPPDLKFDDEADRQKSLKALDDQLADQTYRLEHPDLNYQKLADLGKTPLKESTQLPGMQSVADKQIAAQEEHSLRQTLGIDPKDLEDNPFITMGKSAWNTLAYQLPSAMTAGLAAASRPSKASPENYDPEKLAIAEKKNEEVKTKLLNWAEEHQIKGQEITQNLVSSLDKIEDPIDALNWLSYAFGQAAGQIPASVASMGVTSIGQEVGSIYLEGIQKIAREKNLTISEVIDQKLDHPAFALAYGTMAGALDYLSAKNVLSISKQGLQQSLQNRAKEMLKTGGLEAGTEYSQTWMEQIGASQVAGGDLGKAWKEAHTKEASAERLESAAQGAVGGTGLHAVSHWMQKERPPLKYDAERIKERLSEYIKEEPLISKPDEKVEPTPIGTPQGPEPVSKSPEEKPPPVQSQPPVTEKTSPVSEDVKPEKVEPTVPEIKPEDIHALAKEAGIDYESKEFMAKSKELTGQEHLDSMSPEELTKVKDYLSEQITEKPTIGGTIEKHKEVKASKAIAIKEIAPRYHLKEMEAGMLTNLKGKEIYKIDYFDFNDKPVGLKGQILKKLEDAGYLERLSSEDQLSTKTDSDFVLTDKANEFIDAVEARYQTRKQIKAGSDLFPEDANIPEFIPVLKELKEKTDESTINNFKQRTDDEVEKSESTVADIERKAESGNETQLTEAIQEADKIINESKPEEHALPESGSTGLLQHPQEGVGEKGSQRVGVEPGQQGPETPGPQPEKQGPTPTTEEVGLYQKGEQVDFIGHDGGERKGTVESFDQAKNKYKIKATNGTIWNVEAKSIGVQTESAAAKGTKTITSPDQGKPTTQNGISKPFNMASRVKEVFAKFKIPINEGALRKAYEGVYKYFTGGVRVHALWDIYVAVHEGLHAFDERHNIWENVRKYGSQKLKNELLDAYDNFYPAPKKSASLKERIKEGMAMATQYYAADQTMTEQRFPEVVKHLLQPNGQFFKEDVGEFVGQMKDLADEYFSLNPEEKINARIKWAQNDTRHGMGFLANVRTQLSNDLTSAQIVDNLLGGEYRAKAIQPQVTMLRNLGGLISNWIKHPFGVTSPPQTYLGNSEWGPTKSGYRVEDYMKKLDSPENLIKFNDLLVARRQAEGYNELQELEDQINTLSATDPTSKELPSLIEDHEKLNDTLEKNKLPLELVKAAVKNLESKFQEELKIYDALNGDLVDFMEATGMISKDKADGFRSRKGYAAFQRAIEDEHLANVDDLNLSTSSKGAIKALKKYTGSAKQIIPPTYSQAIAIGEILTKGQRNVVWQAWAEAAKTSKEVAQIFEPVTALDVDPNSKDIQMVLENGVKKYYKMGEEARVFGETLTPTQIEFVSEVMRGGARLFQLGTTGAYPIFGMINITMDAWTRMAQTKTGLIPGWHDFKTMGQAFHGFGGWLTELNTDNDFTDFMALGGRRSTLAAQQLVDPDAALGQMLNKGWWQKTKRIGEIGLQMSELPTNFTELIGRGTEYARAIERGYPSAVAMHMAANVSVNFSNKGKMGGKIGQEMIKWSSYLGASIQALDSFIKNAKENPKRVGSVVALATAVTAVGALMVYMLGDEDEKDMLADQLPEDYARWLYLPASAFGGKSGLIRFRTPEAIGVPAGMIQLYLSHLYREKPLLFKEFYQVGETVLPNPLHFSQGPGIMMSALPTAITPEIQVLTNTRFYPELLPIVPKNLQDYAEWRQYDKYTSRTAKAIGEMTADNLKISPKKFDFYIRAKFGRATQLVQSLAESAIYGDPVKSYIPMWQEYDRVAFSGRMYNKFWDIKEQADKTAKILEDYKRLKGDIGGDWGPLIKAKIKSDDLASKAYQIRRAMDDISNGNELDPARKRNLFNMILQVVKDEETESHVGLKEEDK